MPKKATKKTTSKKKEEAPMLLTASKVREYIKEQEYRCSGEFIPAFNRQVWLMLKKAIKRAENNGRATVKDIDAL